MEKTNVFHDIYCVYNLQGLMVFVVKYRRKVFTSAILKELREIFFFVCSRFEAKLVEFDEEEASGHLSSKSCNF